MGLKWDEALGLLPETWCGFGITQPRKGRFQVQESVGQLGGGNCIATPISVGGTLPEKSPWADGICIKLARKLGFDCDRQNRCNCTSHPTTWARVTLLRRPHHPGVNVNQSLIDDPKHRKQVTKKIGDKLYLLWGNYLTIYY